MKAKFQELNHCIITCTKCPRLVQFRENVPEKKEFAGQTYWKKSVSGFGDHNAYLLILGLAPSAQGGNRTGRIFTGDASARFLFKGLHQTGFANQSISENRSDGVELHDCYLTAAVKCVPPKNHPTRAEEKNCFPYLVNEFFLLKKIKCVLALGGLAFASYLDYVKLQGGPKEKHAFRHGHKYVFENFPTLYTCYHPSPQNTNTGKLDQKMLWSVLKTIQNDHTQ